MEYREPMKDRKILVVEDDEGLRGMVVSILEDAGFRNILQAGSVREARTIALTHGADLGILDINLPDGSGFNLIGRLRENGEMPIVCLTAKDTPEDILKGFESGADDYVTKPFMPKELVARITALLRRCYRDGQGAVQADGGRVSIDFANASVSRSGKTYPLTNKEREILQALYNSAGRIVTIDRLCENVWGDNKYGYENSLMAHIRRIREKIEEDPSHPDLLVTIKGIGYKLNI